MSLWEPLYYPEAQEIADQYEAHPDGRIRSAKTGRVRKVHRRKGDGYCSLGLGYKGAEKFAYVHRLICFTFHGDPPEGCTQVDHLDTVPWHNAAANLQWSTGADNADKRSGVRLPATPYVEGQIAALQWFSRNAQISGETLREKIAITVNN